MVVVFQSTRMSRAQDVYLSVCLSPITSLGCLTKPFSLFAASRSLSHSLSLSFSLSLSLFVWLSSPPGAFHCSGKKEKRDREERERKRRGKGLLGDFTANQLRRERNGNCVCFQTASLSRALLLLSRSRKERCVQRGRVLIDKKRERERERDAAFAAVGGRLEV
jgi:hypothetical protein